MLTIYLCDDDEILIKKYEGYLIGFLEEYNIEAQLKLFTSGEQLLFYIEDTSQYPDIVILDIIMKDINGIEVAKELRRKRYNTQIIFLSSDESFVFDSFNYSPLNYLLKENLSYTKCKEVLMRAIELYEKKNREIVMIKSGRSILPIELNDIIYAESSNRIILLNCKDNTYQFYSTLSNLEIKLVDKRFLRVHRSFIVNLNYIKKMDHCEITLNNLTKIPIGVTYMKNLKKEYARYLMKNINEFLN